MDKHGSNVKDQKRQGKSGTRITVERPSFQESRSDATSSRTDWSFFYSPSTHPVKLSEQDASPAGKVDNHSLELKLRFSKSLKRYLYSGQASDNYLH